MPVIFCQKLQAILLIILVGLLIKNSENRAVALKQLRYPIKNYRGLSAINMGERWAYVHLIRGSANYPIKVHYEACKCAYLYIFISEASLNKKNEEKMHVEARKILLLILFKWE